MTTEDLLIKWMDAEFEYRSARQDGHGRYSIDVLKYEADYYREKIAALLDKKGEAEASPESS